LKIADLFDSISSEKDEFDEGNDEELWKKERYFHSTYMR